MQLSTHLGSVIQDLRKRKGVSLCKLADASGVGKGNLSTIENKSANIHVDTLGKIASALRTKPEDLLRASRLKL
jgi:transcriptional regulator with XRE-family HTH domain